MKNTDKIQAISEVYKVSLEDAVDKLYDDFKPWTKEAINQLDENTYSILLNNVKALKERFIHFERIEEFLDEYYETKHPDAEMKYKYKGIIRRWISYKQKHNIPSWVKIYP